MTTIKTQSTSRSTAGCDPIILREGNRVRLVFIPTIVDNPANPKASVDGHFIYQRKAASDRWVPVPTTSLSSLRAGEGFKLTLHAQEVRTLLEGIVRLYNFYRQQGIPMGSKTFVQVDQPVATFVSQSERDLKTVLGSGSRDGETMLHNMVKWLATSSGQAAAKKMASGAPERVPAFTALLGLASLKEALAYWNDNLANNSEEFWHTAIANRAYVLSQAFAYPIIVIGSKTYVGGKQISNTGGNIVDFLAAIESTEAVILIEIKTPESRLLGAAYRSGVFPLSGELSGAIAQVLKYRQSFVSHFHSITHEHSRTLTMGEPRCLIIAGNARSELREAAKRESFELQRERLQGVTILTYDELFARLKGTIKLLEGVEETQGAGT